MAVIIKRKAPEAVPVQPIAPAPTITIPGRGSSTITIPAPRGLPPAPPAKQGGGIKVLKFGGGKPSALPVKPLAKPVEEVPAPKVVNPLAATPAGIVYEQLYIGQRVVIKKVMHNVKHYAVGDKGTVTSIMNNNDPMGRDNPGYQYHIILIDEPLDKARKGQTGALFRHEIEAYKAEVLAPAGAA